MAEKSTGNCYICGANLGQAAMKTHLLKLHEGGDGGQECLLLKVEGAYDKNYWLYLDIPEEKTLRDLDRFLRAIWLECCGHMSEFYKSSKPGYGSARHKLSFSSKMKSFAAGDKFFHDYDFGTTTETAITVMGSITRKPQKKTVRLLARNVPPVFKCADCGEKAEYICAECAYNSDNPFYCAKCAEKHECQMMLPVTNSPRMGECGYEGENDTFAFDPASVPIK